MSKVTLKNLSKTFGQVLAVQELNLDIRDGEFFSLLGPSGCGKTTTLRMVAGFEFPTSGQILFDDRPVTFLKPNLRNTGMVFQNFALFPHMTIFENVAFGLQARKMNKPDTQKKVDRALQLVDLAKLESRKVTELSGGQQQRVALARAIVIEPAILLLDEPLSNLDAKLRQETREQIKALQRQLGITTIYVTHDQEEALMLSDRIAVMNQGLCYQVGTASDIYQNPNTAFVAKFVGNSNILDGKISGSDSHTRYVTLSSDLRLQLNSNSSKKFSESQNVTVSIRPENIRFVSDPGAQPNVFEGIIRNVKFSGAIVDYQIDAKGQPLRAKKLIEESDFARKIGSKVLLQIIPSQINILP